MQGGQKLSFDTPLFLGCFLPIVLIAHRLIPSTRGKNLLLLLAGLLFYAFGSFLAPITVLIAAALNYALCRALLRGSGKPTLAAGICGNIALLLAFTYLGRYFGNLQAAVSVVAPVGMSFLAFKCISFLIDAYRGQIPEQPRFFDFLLYISFFPQITAGPITRFSDFQPQLDSREAAPIACGLSRFIVGLAKKLLLAQTLAEAADGVFALDGGALDARLAWLGAIAYMLQIYFDFSGYSDMAIGLGQAFGFRTQENFLHPYTAVSITDFWRRWHISLSSWFRDYVYIPLGGNRRGRLRTAGNKLIVFTLCGLWHGAGGTFLLWGLWHGLLAAAESLLRFRPKRRAARVCGRIYTLLAVCLGFVFFRAPSVAQGFAMVGTMFTGFSSTAAGTVAWHSLANAQTLFIGALGCVLCVPWQRRIEGHPRLHSACDGVRYAVCVVLFALCLMRLAGGDFAPFIYAQF